jgi:hypothetical protein
MIDNVIPQFTGIACERFEDFSTAKHVIKNDKPAKHSKIRALDTSKNTYKHPIMIRDIRFTAVTTHTIWVEYVSAVLIISYLLSMHIRTNNNYS